MNGSALAPAPKRLGWIALRRSGLIIPLTMLVVAVTAAGGSQLIDELVTARSTVVVTSGAGEIGPGFATEAAKLALTYSAALGKDTTLVRTVADEIGERPATVRKRLSVVNPTDTAVLELQYRDADPRRAAAGSRSAVQAIAGSRPATPTVGADTIQIVHLADVPRPPSRDETLIVAVGLILGFALGVVLMLAWERWDRRVDDVGDAVGRTGLPASSLDGLDYDDAETLLEAWSRLSERRPARVAIVPTADRVSQLAEEVAGWLSSATNGSGIVVISAAADGSGPSPEAVCLNSDVRVLLVGRGQRQREVDSVGEILQQFGVPPAWLLFAHKPKRLRDRLATENASYQPPQTPARPPSA